ncbi:acetoacetate--CoA ligase [Tabrizicola sp. TH137]|uniref:acetoacetate--CoA ligase n=1 Tax=Tabrizicola sp. TH137 TaxID=2067452 RepID=UPI000C7A2302|nr:acetoacetate--CoA ligase [Tabrizicola sp. TH137]PLL13666.1 acetoacetate--CoA ligase [Tabrizicola sp. TH137]
MAPTLAAGTDGPLWSPAPARAAGTALARFAARAGAVAGRDLSRYADLHRWSVTDLAGFWGLMWDFADLPGDRPGPVFVPDATLTAARFFPEARLSFAEACLRGPDGDEVIVWRSEAGEERRLTRGDLRAMVARLQRFLRAEGVVPGDRVAALLPNTPEAVALMLACAATGAVWVGCAPEFGAPAVLDRFGQVAPKILFVAGQYHHGGKRFDLTDKARAVTEGLPGLTRVVQVGGGPAIADALPMEDALVGAGAPVPDFPRLPFDHPLCVMFSSGTTGKPKAIIHRAGGVLLQHLKEHRLHCDIGPGDRVFQYSTISWMMWNWHVSALASGATLLLFDGAAMYPQATSLLDYAEDEGATHFGTSAGWLDALRRSGARPIDTHDLSALRCITSTGSPLSAEGFRHVHQAVKADVHLASISGGTDILSCFVLGVPTDPVHAGEIQAPGLGMAVDVVDAAGQPARRGDLVCRQPFPSMPLGFWNDPDGARYHASYFARFPGLWHHGDDAEVTPTGGIVIHGRSDTTLNPAGVRIGTAEIYGPLAGIPEISEAACIGQDWQGDSRIVLFLRLAAGQALTPELEARIRATLRREASPRHVPARILAVPDLPRTVSGKISETAIARVVNGRSAGNADALANPESLTHFRDLSALQT